MYICFRGNFIILGMKIKNIFKIKNYFVKIFCSDLNRLVCCEVYILIVVGIL